MNDNKNTNAENEPIGFFSSFYLYAKLFLYYPIKYTILLTILMAAYKIWTQVMYFGEKAIKYIKHFFCVLYDCALLNKKCRENLILFDIPNVFYLLEGTLKLILGLVYLAVAVVCLIATIMVMIPFNFIVPSYTAFYYN